MNLAVVHGFAVVRLVFGPLQRSLRRRRMDSHLIRYPSVGLSLDGIIDRVVDGIDGLGPDAIVAHSLGCVATLDAVRRTAWTGPIVLLAPPMKTIPSTTLIPNRLRVPFAPLLDHRRRTSTEPIKARLSGCRIRAIAGRFDLAVPPGSAVSEHFDDFRVVPVTHNGMLFSRVVVDLIEDWCAPVGGG